MSCLFDALAMYVKDCSSNKLRQILADVERQNPVLPNGLSFAQNIAPTPLDAYHQWISNPKSWGGALEISVFAMLFRTNVQVQMLHQNKTIVFSPATQVHKSLIITWDGHHYGTPVRHTNK